MGQYIEDSEIYLPDTNETHWGSKVNRNFEILNNVKTNISNISTTVSTNTNNINSIKASVNNNLNAINKMESDIARNKVKLESLSIITDDEIDNVFENESWTW